MTKLYEEKIFLCKESACTGCAACAASCSKRCISLRPDNEGFQRPVVDYSKCTGCKNCSSVCPILIDDASQPIYSVESDKIVNNTITAKSRTEKVEQIAYAAWNLDEEIRKKSSSGGVFSVLAEVIINKGGVVVGAAFDNSFTVRHIIIEKISDIYRLRGSKYVQSEIEPAILCLIRDMLEKRRNVLFSGTPCEVAGLLFFLNKSYNNLYCCDLVCHGVPSPLLFKQYKKHLESNSGRLLDISFRDKINGWKKYSIYLKYENGRNKFISMKDDSYMIAFLRDYALRPSCYECRYKKLQRNGDITIADFWGVDKKYPEYDLDDKGTSLILVNSIKGKWLIDACKDKLFIGNADVDTAISGNPSLVRSSLRPSQRDTFYRDLKNLSFGKLVKRYKINISFYMAIKRYIKNYFSLKKQRKRK
jgi:coenzyme F420-reducing hydrogenase beta subunit